MAATQAPVRPGARRNTQRKPRVLTSALMAAAVLGLAWFGWAKTHPSQDPMDNLLTATVTRGDLQESVNASGSVTAQTGAQVKIGSQITGRIKRLFADVGTEVKAGQVIAELDLPDVAAQLNQAQANLTLAQTKAVQQQSGVSMERTQTANAISEARSALNSARAKYDAAVAEARQQHVQTPTDIRRAQTALSAANAALSTAKANLAQAQSTADLQVNAAQQQLNQARAQANDQSINLKRQTELYKQGFVAASTVDDAKAATAVAQSQVSSAQSNLQVVRHKVATDSQSAQDQVATAEENVVAAQAGLEAAKAGTYTDRSKQAAVADAQAQVRQAAAALQTALANTTQNTLKAQDVQQAQEAVTAARAQVDFNRAQEAKTFIRSPISGTVLQLAAQQGETLAAGLSAPTLIVVADLNRLQVDAYVDETDIGKVRLGQPVDVTVDAFPHRVFKGRVSKIASGSTIQQGVVTYDVAIALDNPGHRLKPDMSASVTINTGTRSNVLLVPSEAVKIGVRGSTVSVLTKKDGKTEIETRRVRTGASDGTNTEIRDGLQEGDVVVRAGLSEGGRRFGPANPFGPNSGGRGGRGGGPGGGGPRGG